MIGWAWDLWSKGETRPGSWNDRSGQTLVVQTSVGGIGMEEPAGEDEFYQLVKGLLIVGGVILALVLLFS